MAAAFVLVGCQPVATVPKPARGGTAVEALVGQASVVNPLFETNDTTRDVDSLIYQGLTAVDSREDVVGLLASGWAVSPDHMTYTFDIRNDVKWGDGELFSADDVLFTFHVLQDLEYDQPSGAFWRDVGVAAGGPGQVVFSLKAPSASFPLDLQVGIIPKHVFAGMAPAQIAQSPFSGVRAFGTGPFKVASITDLAITLDRNPYANPQPYLDHLVLRTYPATDPQMAIEAVVSGAADLVGGIEPQEIEALQGRTSVSIQEARLFTNSFASLNPEGDGRVFFSDTTVRIALSQAIDRQRLINEVLAGRADPDATPIPTAGWAYSSVAASAHPYDPVAAAKALDAAGWLQDPASKLRVRKGNQFRVTMVAADSYPNREIAQGIAQQLLQIGVEVDVKTMPASQLVNDYLIARNYEMALVTFDVGSDPDQYALWHTGGEAGSINFAYTRGWGLIDKDLEDGRAAVDPPSRLAAYLDFQVLMVNEAPAIFLYAGRYDYAVSQRVHGVHMDKAIEPWDRFRYVTDWYVNTTG